MSPIKANVLLIDIEESDCVRATLIPLEVIYRLSHWTFSLSRSSEMPIRSIKMIEDNIAGGETTN